MSVVAHDLRNPLHIFMIVLNRRLRTPPSDAQSAARELPMLQCATLIHYLLDVPRIESGTFATVDENGVARDFRMSRNVLTLEQQLNIREVKLDRHGENNGAHVVRPSGRGR